MKKRLFVVCALAAISLLAPSAGFAQAWENRIGIYTSEVPLDDGSDTEILAPTLNLPFNVYFVLSNPKFADGSPVTQVDASEFTVTIGPAASGIFKLSQTLLTGTTLNIGADGNPFNAEYVAGSSTPVPVVNGVLRLMTWTLMMTVNQVYYFYLNPTSVPALPGTMAINYPAIGAAEAVLIACTASSGSGVLPVFAMGAETIATENDTFGGVKALFR